MGTFVSEHTRATCACSAKIGIYADTGLFVVVEKWYPKEQLHTDLVPLMSLSHVYLSVSIPCSCTLSQLLLMMTQHAWLLLLFALLSAALQLVLSFTQAAAQT